MKLMRINEGNGMSTSENGFMWDNLFNFQTLIFIAILMLLLWGIYTYFKTRNLEQQQNNNDQEARIDFDYNRELQQANMRAERLNNNDRNNGIDWNDDVKTDLENLQNDRDFRNS